VKLVVHGPSLEGQPGRMRMAIRGLAARGHEVWWCGGHAPAGEGVRACADPRSLHGLRADVAVGEGPPGRIGWLGWRARTRALVLGSHAADFARWSLLDHLAWESAPAYAFLESGEAASARDRVRNVPHDRIALWSDDAPATEPDPAHPDVDVLERAAERLLAVQQGRAGHPAVFVDRDGTLIEEHGYLSDPARVKLLPGVASALRALAAAGLPVVVVSNQSGVGRGKFTLAQAHATMAQLRRLLREEGVELDAVRFCPHRPEDGCACRKPGTALLEEAAADLRASLFSSVMVGDKRLDAATGQAAGGLGVLVRTGYGREEEARLVDEGPSRAPDGIVDDFAAAATWILARHEAL
jgi:D-glycero-D-manno-heptose 1,7-bisphosphate phosphatase